ncbi:MAG: hypothetical protein WB780_24630 [Candidatus Acidiferrales bacterium]
MIEPQFSPALEISIGRAPLVLFNTPASHCTKSGPSIDWAFLNVTGAACVRRNTAGVPGFSAAGKGKTRIPVSSGKSDSK